ncbi:UBE3B (predicted) [Pycnogonum litorale]
MFRKQDQRQVFLDQTKQARVERAVEKKRECHIICVQKYVRGFLARKKLRKEIMEEFDQVFGKICKDGEVAALPPALELYYVVRKFLTTFQFKADAKRFNKVCQYVVSSMSSPNLKECYISVGLNKDESVRWIQHVKCLLWQCCLYLKNLKLEHLSDQESMMLYLHALITFNSVKTWTVLENPKHEALKPVLTQLCSNIQMHLVTKGLYAVFQRVLLNGLSRSKPHIKKASLVAIMSLALRPLIVSQFSENMINMYILHILSVPALVHHLSNIAGECLTNISQQDILKRSVTFLVLEQNCRIIFNCLEGNYALCLLANLTHLAHENLEVLKIYRLEFAHVVNRFLENCQKYVSNKPLNLTQWHPVLGWSSQKIDNSLRDSMPLVRKQLQLLWSGSVIKVLFVSLFDATEQPAVSPSTASAPTFQVLPPVPRLSNNILRKAFERATNKTSGSLSSNKYKKLGGPEATNISVICSMYQNSISTLSQFKLDVLTGLCYNDSSLLPKLWKFIKLLGPNSGIKSFLDLLAMSTKSVSPEFQMLMLFCDCSAHLITLLDDIELYEKQIQFTVDDLISISSFLNNFIFKIIWNNLIDLKTASSNPLLNSTHTLLMLLYQRDCRRNYTPNDHWLIKDVRVNSFMNDLDKGKRSAQILLQKVPHIIPHKERVILFRRYVFNEKTVLGLTESVCTSPQSTMITVNRSHIVEDGYEQLAQISPQSLKGVIRVKFINEQGLDEAGIDQDGVFKEFLEETINRVFNPELNLFKVTADERLYPSPTSYIQENHLAMYEFVGRMLGKAVYEGIVVDAPFASFFLSQVLGHQTNNALYSCIDELPSLDENLYKSLTYVKHYDGDVEDLSLTFSCDEDNMGELVSHELIPGGKAIPVTNENKLNYIYLMAHFRMSVQIREQTKAFIHGFRSIINHEWLMMFSTPELQRLISGDTSTIDLEDLRKHTIYYGGFHNNHRVIMWLWETLEKDFTEKERSLFLKFVTSCSKPPLLGFAHLEPAFSIRCVEVSDDLDTGDTVASVIRGFFTVHHRDPIARLPTSSTCFNLLKLPNYQKKNTLRLKLRYAITSNTGFELS